MKLASFSPATSGNKSPRIGLVIDTGIIDVSKHLADCPSEMKTLIDEWDQWSEKLKSLTKLQSDFALKDCQLYAPVSRPGKIMGMGLNYSDHAAEANMELPKEQMWFCKAVTSVNGPYDVIQLPKVSTKLDYEAELVFIIGKRCRHVSREDAKSVIFGYCAGNDVSVRDWQFKSSQFNIGKSFDSHAPFGPWIVTPDEIDPHNLAIRCTVNGEERQNSNTAYFIFDCYDMVAFLSQAMTLEPGDVFYTGTPSGVGAVMTPPKWLKEGDIVRVEIEGIGAIENKVLPE
ncbi:MAG: fumarylacetoacetate hydrolase family protein [Porticoccaceae bacterium]|jgi:2-keto-4-pentenoate hydratase/2-oxohepta-3-ene-1,7-dioic acid hydratase in catechol pathway